MSIDEKYEKIKEWVKKLSDINYQNDHFIFIDGLVFYRSQGNISQICIDWDIILMSEIIQLYDELKEIIGGIRMKDVNYWDDIHKNSWDKGINGLFQTAVFAAQTLSNLSIRHWEKFMNAGSLLDVGCAWGQAGAIFDGLFKYLDVTCIDSSTEACKKVAENYSRIGVLNFSVDRENIDHYDIVYCSQLLAFEQDPKTLLELLARIAEEMLIFVVPYDQNLEGRVTEPIEGHEPGGHISGLTRKDFPKFIEGLERTTFKILERTEICEIPQLLVIYEKLDEKGKADIQFKEKQMDEWWKYLLNR